MSPRRALAVLLLTLVWRQTGGENYHPERTKFIDAYPRLTPTKFLFRGNMPVVNGSFAYTQIVSTMKDIVHQQGFVMPTTFDLIVVSYLNIFEWKDLDIEYKFFQSNHSVGEFYNIVVTGTEIKPPNEKMECGLVKEFLDVYEKDVSFDDLPTLTARLHGLLTQHERPALIYTHCEAGTDRTGEVSGAYYLKYLNMSFSEALTRDNHVQNRDMYKTSRNAMQWYCLYLLCYEGYAKLNCTVPTPV